VQRPHPRACALSPVPADRGPAAAARGANRNSPGAS